jgi:hypothetical protein
VLLHITDIRAVRVSRNSICKTSSRDHLPPAMRHIQWVVILQAQGPENVKMGNIKG